MSSRAPSSIQSILEPREKIVSRGGLHWIYLVSGFFWMLVLAAIGWGSEYVLWTYLADYIPANFIETPYLALGLRPGWIGGILTAYGLFLFLAELVSHWTTGIYVTTMRVLYKRGLLNVRVNGTDISDIRGVHVDQGWLGRFLNYGRIRLDCRFIDDVYVPFIADPYKTARNVQHMKSDMEGSQEHATKPAPEYQPRQTIIQIQSGLHGTQITQKDDRTILIQPQMDEPRSLTHRLHDEILEDFKNKA